MITEFFKPTVVAEAVALKQEHPHALFMAGGTWINSSRSKLSPETVISLSDLKLDEIETSNDIVSIGATVCLQDLLSHSGVPESIKENAAFFKNKNIRNQGTIGGLIATRNPAFSLFPLL